MLSQNDSFKEKVSEVLDSSIPMLEELFTERIDEYSSLIEKSVLCDDIVWHWIGSSCGSHTTWENNVRSLKYFSNTRLDYLCSTYNCHKESTYSPKRLSMRSVDFIIDDNTIITKQYNDYETIDFNELAKSLNLPKGNWILAHSEEKINQYFPIIEDCTIKFIPAE